MNIEYFYDADYSVKFHPRKKEILSPKTLIKGGFNSGKTYLLLNSLDEYKKDEILYLDLADLRVKFSENELINFINSTKNIKALGIDNLTYEIPALNSLNLEKIVLSTTLNSLNLDGFKNLNLYMLDFEEFISFEKRSDDLGILMSRFLSIGNGAKNSFLNSNDRVKFIQNSLLSMLNKSEILALMECAKFNQNSFSINQIYTNLKSNFKISKDTLYQAITRFENENLLFFLHKFGTLNKRVYFYDFSLSDALALKKDFNKKLINALLCELLYLKDEKFYTDKLDIVIPNINLAFLVIPFTPPDLINLRFKTLTKELKELEISKLFVITMGNSAKFESEFCECEVMPFWEFALGFDL
ncbi:ATP-binding protein [Campylobacter corcagiensis]|uniref:ATP-binding protein n=1 Tax=Campylobacter corcagiensis TaxID=1448857 RepID=A0A7M1LHN9_9BACT|nr:ATP-binding protein [Campylobacter corcagiensis]QKF65473.1 ATP-binding protein (AAA domain) [Campylobacter corcagiensis]QOQ87950.1 ATP-binding protein [Campylobacter corcagiensis]